MNKNCIYTTVTVESEGNLKVIPKTNRGVLVGFSDWRDGEELLGIVVDESGSIVTINVKDIKVI